MKITYDLEHIPEKGGGPEREDKTAIIAFLAGQQKNMCIEYDEEKEAKSRYSTLRNFRRTNELQTVFDIYRREKCIYVVRLKKTAKAATGKG